MAKHADTKKPQSPLNEGPKALTVSQMQRLKIKIEKARKQARPEGGGGFVEYVG